VPVGLFCSASRSLLLLNRSISWSLLTRGGPGSGTDTSRVHNSNNCYEEKEEEAGGSEVNVHSYGELVRRGDIWWDAGGGEF
jgi:hypothetical protein